MKSHDSQMEASPKVESPTDGPVTGGSRFLRACLRQPVDRTPVWFLRQAGRYMPEYQAVRRAHTLIEICKRPELAADVTITAAEKLGVDAAIIFADLLLPLEPMGLDFEFQAGEGPKVHRPLRSAADIHALRTDRTAELGYVAEAIRQVVEHFGDRMGMIGFCGAPFTLASYMIEGGGSRNYIETKRLMYADPAAWQALDAEADHCAGRVFGAAGEGRRRRDPNFRQLGGCAIGYRLSGIRSADYAVDGAAGAGAGSAGDLFWR